MSGSAIIYLIPYVISLVISAAVGIYAWNRRDVAGALPFALFAWAEASWTAGYIFELLANSLQAKLFWDNTQFFGSSCVPLFLLAFALDYSGHRLTYRRTIWGSLFALVAIFLVAVFAFAQHSWVRPAAWIVDEKPFSTLLYDFGSIIWLYSGGLYAILLAAYLPLLSQFIYAQRVYRVQIALILVGVTIPLVGSILSVLDIRFSVHRDTSPITFAIGNLIIAWGLFRYRLFDLVPVARNLVVDSMSDQVFVLDAHDRLIDLNEAA